MSRYAWISCLLFLSMIPPEEKPVYEKINDQLIAWSGQHIQERSYIHTDKPFYLAGEDIWFKAYLMIGPYQTPDTMSAVLYVELIDQQGNLVARKNVHIREGLGYGDFHLAPTLIPGKFMIRAYTHYMQNYDQAYYFRKGVSILPAFQYDAEVERNSRKAIKEMNENPEASPVRLGFYPEGGDLMEGLQSKVAFRINDTSGKGLEAEGVIKNSKGEEVTRFKTRKFGMGYFLLTPVPDEVYAATILYGNKPYTFPLPQAKKQGYVLHINKTGDKVYCWVRNNMGVSMNNSFVIGHYRGFPFITVKGSAGQEFLYALVSVKEIPSGIMCFTFFDSLGIPRCERLVYNENPGENVKYSMESDKNNYGKREKTTFRIHCTNLNGIPVLTNLSLSVTNTSIINPDDNRSSILSYFDLESDLPGTIESPGYYFNPENPDRLGVLDELLLTQGWRRFTWQEVMEEHPGQPEFSAERGFDISGRLVDFYNPAKIQPGFARIFIFKNKLYYQEVKTDDKGSFQFNGLDINDSTQVVMQAWRIPPGAKKMKPNKQPKTKNDLAIQVLPQSFPDVNLNLWPLFIEQPVSYSGYLGLNNIILSYDSAYHAHTIMLKELTVRERKIIHDPFERPGKLYGNPSNRIVMDSIPVSSQSLRLFDIVRKYVPNILIRGAPPDLQILMRGPVSLQGSNEPLILLDGVPVESDFMYDYPSSEIAFIDILKTSATSMYGGITGNGVIAFYTKSQAVHYADEGRKGIINFVRNGYAIAREFYTPDYDTGESKLSRPDYRRTLYWNPSLTTNDHGDIQFSFYTSDETANYRVDVQGMTYSGIPVVREYYFSVE